MNERNTAFVILSLKADTPQLEKEDLTTPTLTKTPHRHFLSRPT